MNDAIFADDLEVIFNEVTNYLNAPAGIADGIELKTNGAFMSLGQVNFTQSLLAPLLQGTPATDVVRLTNAAIGVMQPVHLETLMEQRTAANVMAKELGFWLPPFNSSSDGLDVQFAQVTQPLFLRGLMNSSRIDRLLGDAMFKNYGDESAGLVRRPIRAVVASGVLAIDARAAIESGVIIPFHSGLSLGARRMLEAIDGGDKPFFWGQQRMATLRDKAAAILAEDADSSIDDRTLRNISIARAKLNDLFHMRDEDPDFGIAAIREEWTGKFAGKEKSQLPIFAFKQSSDVELLTAKPIPFVLVGPSLEIRILLPDAKFDAQMQAMSPIARLLTYGVVAGWKGDGPSSNEWATVTGFVRKEGDAVVVSPGQFRAGSEYAAAHFGRVLQGAATVMFERY